ncbi:uncharacterized protein TNCV_875361 [Trichonephila clavipes]|nr:uncharacterized protein TNCV_875361 [Trichonephila clavipes]
MTCIAQRRRTSLKERNSNGPSVKWGNSNGHRLSVKRTNFKYQMGNRGGEMGKRANSKYQMRKGETHRPNSPSMQEKQPKHVRETSQSCKGNRPSIQKNEAKHAMESDQA